MGVHKTETSSRWIFLYIYFFFFYVCTSHPPIVWPTKTRREKKSKKRKGGKKATLKACGISAQASARLQVAQASVSRVKRSAHCYPKVTTTVTPPPHRVWTIVLPPQPPPPPPPPHPPTHAPVSTPTPFPPGLSTW